MEEKPNIGDFLYITILLSTWDQGKLPSQC